MLKEVLKRNRFINNSYIKYKWREHRVSYGEENPDKTFYVVRRAPSKVGLFSYVATCMGYIKYAVDQGYIPVIDMQNCENTYLESGQIGKCNAWEFYFEQPCGYTLADIAHSKNIILGNGLLPKEYPGIPMVRDESNYAMWREYSRKYLKINQTMREIINQTYSELLQQERTVGVLCRGTDYTNSRPPQHPIQPELGDVIAKTEEFLNHHHCEYVYLATEDENVYRHFQEAFGNQLKVTAAKRYADVGSENINDIAFERENDYYLKGVEYLVNIGVLAKCDCLVAGCVGGLYGTLLLTEGYEEAYLYWLGCYPGNG